MLVINNSGNIVYHNYVKLGKGPNFLTEKQTKKLSRNNGLEFFKDRNDFKITEDNEKKSVTEIADYDEKKLIAYILGKECNSAQTLFEYKEQEESYDSPRQNVLRAIEKKLHSLKVKNTSAY